MRQSIFKVPSELFLLCCVCLFIIVYGLKVWAVINEFEVWSLHYFFKPSKKCENKLGFKKEWGVNAEVWKFIQITSKYLPPNTTLKYSNAVVSGISLKKTTYLLPTHQLVGHPLVSFIRKCFFIFSASSNGQYHHPSFISSCFILKQHVNTYVVFFS